ELALVIADPLASKDKYIAWQIRAYSRGDLLEIFARLDLDQSERDASRRHAADRRECLLVRQHKSCEAEAGAQLEKTGNPGALAADLNGRPGRHLRRVAEVRARAAIEHDGADPRQIRAGRSLAGRAAEQPASGRQKGLAEPARIDAQDRELPALAA